MGDAHSKAFAFVVKDFRGLLISNVDNRRIVLPVLLGFTLIYVYFYPGGDYTLATDRLYLYNE